MPDCPNLAPLLDRLGQLTDLLVTTRRIHTDADAVAAGMAGSPTLLINGRDPFTTGGGHECGLSCRIYRDGHGHPVSAPTLAQLRAALAAASPAAEPDSGASAGSGAARPPGLALSDWRAKASPLDPVEKRVHQAILRGFAATGRPPAPPELGAITAGSGRAIGDVLGVLHELDTIRLAPDGQIAVAYPFSARPTRHRVRIGDRSDAGALQVYAMCAIDALGISAMLGQDTHIDSVDATSGQPISVTTAAGNASWDPPGAVVFVGADPCGGPSADCCCDYLNFFTDHTAATAWALTHSHIPGQILTQAEAEQLGARLFGHLLATT
ncbi:hypothetical protein GCM10023321_31750 [Pseudonocardia eucalypti]|uniref:Alkylmercury lyase-like protein n=1 Tax=Pseudonocardia eucalypti TaxID=648755 RepID=A0ABP9Q3D9_9PSEU